MLYFRLHLLTMLMESTLFIILSHIFTNIINSFIFWWWTNFFLQDTFIILILFSIIVHYKGRIPVFAYFFL